MAWSPDTAVETAAARLPPALRSRVAATWAAFRPHAARPGPKAARWLETLPAVWAASEFVAHACLQDPALILELVESGDLFRAYAPEEPARRVQAALRGAADEPALKRRLRRLRRREWVRIAWRELAGWAGAAETFATLSGFADACLQAAVQWLYADLALPHGTPRAAGAAAAVPFVVFALGKLGGRELNFSSDIDLMFAYPEDGRTDGPMPLENHEFFTRLARRLIAVLEEPTAEGFVFRVDLRLRPNGASGPLVLGFDAMEDYYQAHGREWERYALVKARPAAGDLEAGGRLLERLRPFVYRRYLDYGAIEAIRAMKSRIHRELYRKGMRENIKLGPGGIREIEFIVQTYQLIRGGRVAALVRRELLPVLDYLGSAGMLPAPTAAQLRDDYLFLRRLEHRLQMLADQQTQLLPQGELARARVAFAMGLPGWPALVAELRRRMERVHGHFERLFAAAASTAAPVHGLADVWLETVDEAGARRILAEAGYRPPEAALQLLGGLRGGAHYRALSAQGRARMDRLMPLLLEAAARVAEPVTALGRLVQVLEAIGRRTAYLALLVENPVARTQLAALCAASPWIANWIGGHPVLLDELLDPLGAAAPPGRAALADELRQRLARLPSDDLEVQMEALREFRHAHVLRVAAADIGSGTAAEAVSMHLSEIAEVVIGESLALAWHAMAARYGEPLCPDAGAGRRPGFAVIAYGKLGSRELGYGSDVDMIFLYELCSGGTTGGERSVPNETFFARVGQRLIHILGSRTPAGILYEVDMRLRPSGRAGPLVTAIEAFRDYQLHHAWTWEHQALVRARAIAGSAALGARFERVRREVLQLRRDPERLRVDVREMRERMRAAHEVRGPGRFDLKQGRGGLVDVEFIVQYCVLRWAAEEPALTRYTDNIRILRVLAETGRLAPEQAAALRDAYRRYLGEEHRCRLMERPPLVQPDRLRGPREAVAAIWDALLGAG